jgi:hypothetical protein
VEATPLERRCDQESRGDGLVFQQGEAQRPDLRDLYVKLPVRGVVRECVEDVGQLHAAAHDLVGRRVAEAAGDVQAIVRVAEKMGTDHVFMKGAKRRPEKRGLSPIFPLFFRRKTWSVPYFSLFFPALTRSRGCTGNFCNVTLSRFSGVS